MRNEDNKIVGQFESSDPEVQILNCNDGHRNAITHLNNRKKSKIHATWIAPEDAKIV